VCGYTKGPVEATAAGVRVHKRPSRGDCGGCAGTQGRAKKATVNVMAAPKQESQVRDSGVSRNGTQGRAKKATVGVEAHTGCLSLQSIWSNLANDYIQCMQMKALRLQST
jgi:hypothetical protein